MIKKILAMILVMVLMVSMIGCTDKTPADTLETASTPSEEKTEEKEVSKNDGVEVRLDLAGVDSAEAVIYTLEKAYGGDLEAYKTVICPLEYCHLEGSERDKEIAAETEDLSEHLDKSRKEYGNDFEITIEFKSEKPFSSDLVEYYTTRCNEKGLVFEGGKIFDTTMLMRGSKKSRVEPEDIAVVKINGKWYMSM